MAGKNSKVVPEKVPLETDQGILDSEERKWGIPLKEVYKHGLLFYKDKEGKAIHLSYEDRLKLVAYTQQTAHGPLDLSAVSPLGVLDVIGRDRRAAWQALGHMSQTQAMAGFIHTLDRLCPLFKPYIEAIHKDGEHKRQQEVKKQEDEKSHEQLQNRVIEERQNQLSNKLTEEQQVQKIKDALNAQTYDQFLQYAQQQFPGNFDQQAVLVRQLQDQHYQQYIQQLAVDQRLAGYDTGEEKILEKDPDLNDQVISLTATDNKEMQTSGRSEVTECAAADESRDEDSDGEPDDEDDDGFPPIDRARMWVQADIVRFKQSAEASRCKLTVGHGETVTVRVPTHPRARCLCWEFATDNYDIGFGVYFEWGKSPTSDVTIHVAESDEEDDVDNDDDEQYDEVSVGDKGGLSWVDPESGVERRSQGTARPPVSAVVPVYRRDCHTEVYAGSHLYPGEGVYLLKFDNTYSLWRSKTLYYKVYYTQ